ncbi:ferrochelatase [Candidatus Sumerlaeota bacterium]|nr:ferrochelatase [Candidatus Sumerlaeota bacterium]
MRDSRKVLLLTYGEPESNRFSDQFWYSLSILNRLTRRVAPIPRPALPLIAWKRARRRVREWRPSDFGSPLEAITRRQAELLAAKLNAELQREGSGETAAWEVEPVFEFRKPMLIPTLRAMAADSSGPVFILPAYVADSAFTDEISRSDIEKLESRGGSLPFAVHYVSDFANDPALAEIMADFILDQLRERGLADGATSCWGLILGSHGTLVNPPIPIETGLSAMLGLYEAILKRVGSRFASCSLGWLNHTLGGKWTEPSLREAASAMREAGITKIVYYPFGFFADNAETLLEGETILKPFGFERIEHLPCMNEEGALISFLARRVIEAAAQAARARRNPEQSGRSAVEATA